MSGPANPPRLSRAFLAVTSAILALAMSIPCVGCATDEAETRRSGPTSTPMLRLLRDWRGVWAGPMREGPLGPMDYTLHVDRKSHSIHLEMVLDGYADEPVRNEFALMNLDGGTPKVRALLTLHGRTIIRDYVYEPSRSGSDKASFCIAGRGCLFGELTFARGKDGAVHIKVLSEENVYADATVRLVQRNIPEKKVVHEKATLKRRPMESSDGSVRVTAQEVPHPNSRAAKLKEQEKARATAKARAAEDDSPDDEEEVGEDEEGAEE